MVKVLEDWEAADQSEDRGRNYHNGRRCLRPALDIFVRTRLYHLHLAGNLYLPNRVWGLPLR